VPDDDRAVSARERVQQPEERLRRLRARMAEIDAGGKPGSETAQHRIRAAWHREHAEADRLRLDDERHTGAVWRSTWDSPHRFSCQRVDLDEVTVLVVIGDVDLDTAPELRRVIYGAIREGGRRLLVDMTDTSFCDSTGLGVLVGALRRARAENGWIRLVNPNRQVGKVLRITYLDHVFPVHESLDDARAQVSVSQDELIARRWQPGRSW
jgi:anti-sigma B factor antagonist